MDTLMTGERIIEAIEVADTERRTFAAYEEEKATLEDPSSLPPPAKHPVLAALNQSPEEHVFNTIEKVPSAELYDALLVLPFGKVISLLEYLNEAALQVGLLLAFSIMTHSPPSFLRSLGMEPRSCLEDHVFSS
jgi:U3 small nucleolar RNA-associated protein 12